MSTMETPPPPDAMVPPGPPERRCPRCGSTLAPEQEWCLACGAAAGTEVVESRGWRVPIYLGGGLVALAILGVILAIAAMSDREETPTPTPTPSAGAPPASTPSPLPTIDPAPTASATPTADPLNPDATPTVDPLNPDATPTASPEETVDPEPTAEPTQDPGTGTGGFTGNDGDYTVIIASETSESKANSISESANGKGHTTGVLNSDDYGSLNGGYWVVYSGAYATKSEAEDALDAIKSDYSDAYVKRIKS